MGTEPNITLLPHHQQQLRDGSGLSEAVIAERGYVTATLPDILEAHGLSHTQARVLPGLFLPLWTVDGNDGCGVYRPDHPRVVRGKPQKYEMPKGSGVRLDCPPRCRPMLANPNIPLWITEGIKKADALASHDLCAIDLLGVWNFKGKNAYGASTILADWDYIALKGLTGCKF
jgi:hypothetical protein